MAVEEQQRSFDANFFPQIKNGKPTNATLPLTMATMAKPESSAEVLDVAFSFARLSRRRRQERTMCVRCAGVMAAAPEVESTLS